MKMEIALTMLASLFVAACYVVGSLLANRCKLQEEIADKDRQIGSLKRDLKMYEIQIDDIMHVDNSIPEGCIRGPYCEACAFVKRYHVPNELGKLRLVTLCGKGASCDCFIERGETK